MSVPAAYLAVIIIWTTTPLGVVWSSENVNPEMASMLRMAIAAALGLLMLRFMKIEMPWHRAALRTYGYGVIGVFGAMYCTYQSAVYISSGLISVLFGFSPIVTGLLAQKILGDTAFTKRQWVALALALSGLVLVCSDDLVMSSKGWYGIVFISMAVFFFSLSAVKVKQRGAAINAFAFTIGSMVCSLPFYLVAWLLADGSLPQLSFYDRSTLAILYLAMIGSLLGFMSYFFLLKKMSAASVNFITLITPVFAVFLGVYLNDEQVGPTMLWGICAVICGLVLYQSRSLYLLLQKK